MRDEGSNGKTKKSGERGRKQILRYAQNDRKGQAGREQGGGEKGERAENRFFAMLRMTKRATV